MDFNTWTFIQHALIYVFEPVLGYWLTGIAVTGIAAALYILMLSFFRWLTGQGSLI